MDIVFEYLFYLGLLLLISGAVWALVTLVRGRWKRLVGPILLVLFGLAIMATPALLSRYVLTADRTRREAFVDDERHITVTGWDGESYDFLKDKDDTIVLQMANADVSDETLQLLAEMQQLRELDLNDSAVTDSGLEILSTLTSLETLRLRGTGISDEGFKQHLMPLPKLKNVDVRQTEVKSETIESWKTEKEGRRALQ